MQRLVGEEASVPGPDEATLQAFVDRWGLAEDAVNVLLSLTASVQRVVVEKFSPMTEGKVHAANRDELDRAVDGKFIVFARSIEKAGGNQMMAGDLQGFVDKWGLGEDAVNVLTSLGADIQREVVTSFAPKTEDGRTASGRAELARECDGKFILFARSVQKAGKSGGKGKDYGNGCYGKGMDMDWGGDAWGGWWGPWGGKPMGKMMDKGWSGKGWGKYGPY